MSDTPPNFPVDALRSAADSDQARADVDALHAELAKDQPSADAINAHVDQLRKRPPLFAIVANWFDDPRTQTFLADLSSAGL
jgi:hypothetical protein